jgi:DNA polymerase III delta subunit
MTKLETINEVSKSFENFNKWTTYYHAFDLMDKGLIKLFEIRAIANGIGISSDVINMRRMDYLKMTIKSNEVA